jgi:hypothetical protein
MRASFVVLGPLVESGGKARVSLPRGCSIRARPIDQHLKGLSALGAEIRLDHGSVEAIAPRCRLHGADFTFVGQTVTGTENVMRAAALAEGRTVLRNCAREPEVTDLARALVRMGARIEGAGTDEIRIEGVTSLRPLDHTVIPDRIEAGTFLVAGALPGGDVTVRGCIAEDLEALVEKLRAVGAEIGPVAGGMRVVGDGRPRPADVRTGPHPGFPTDAQQQVRVQLASTLQGVISQTLVAKVGGGRVAAREILVATDAVRSLIREAKSPQILNLMQTGKQYGMVTLEDDLLRFCAEGLIQGDDAVAKANRPDDVRKRLGQAPARPAPAGIGMGGNGMGSMFGNGAASAARTPNARMPGPIGVRR